MNQPGRTKDIVSKCVQIAFIVAGSAYMGYYKTLKHAGIDVVGGNAFVDNMYPIVKSMLDEICEAAKQETKRQKRRRARVVETCCNGIYVVNTWLA